MVVVASRSPADVVVLLLLASSAMLLAFTATTGVAAATNSSTICDTAECGKGTCSEVPGIIPVVTDSYKCNCDPGWSQPKVLNVSVVAIAPFLPCIIPDCLFDSACYNFSLIQWKGAIPITDPCVIIDCGLGVCKKGESFFSYRCECLPGYLNFLNLPALPCIKNCTLGADCSKQGIVPPPAPSPSAASTPTGSVSSWRLLQQLLSLAILLLLQVL